MADIARLAAVISANTGPLDQGLNHAVNKVQGFSKDVNSSFTFSANAVKRFGNDFVGALDLPPGIRQAWGQLADGIDVAATSMEKAAGGAISLKGALAATGIGLAVVAVTGLVSWLSKLQSEEDKAAAAAARAFGAIIDGSKTAAQAMSDLRLSTLSEGLTQTMTQVQGLERMSDWQRRNRSLRVEDREADISRALNRGVSEAINRAELAERMLARMLNNPRYQLIQHTAATERATSGADATARGLEDQVARLGMGADEAQRFALAQDLAARGGMSLNRALEILGPTLERMRIAQEKIAANAAWTAALQRAAQIADEFRTPGERLIERLAEINRLVFSGAMDWQTWGRAFMGIMGQANALASGPVDALARRLQQAQAERASAGMTDAERRFNELVRAGLEAEGLDGGIWLSSSTTRRTLPSRLPTPRSAERPHCVTTKML